MVCKETSIKLSVIIPVYNVEKYLERCLDSILQSPSKEMELICVNDGSSDNSMKILEAYARSDSRISLITQTNRGLSAARNAGFDASKGEYILYIDSDDFVKPENFFRLLQQIKLYPQAELFVTDFNMVRVSGKTVQAKHIYQIGEEHTAVEGIDFLPSMLQRRQCFWNVWRYLYKRSFLKRENIRFKEGVLCEDIDYTTKVFMASPQTVFLHCPYYCYRVARTDSLMGRTTSRRITDTTEILRDSITSLAGSNFPWRQELIRQYQFEFILTLAQLYEVPHKDRPALCRMFKNGLPMLCVGSDRLAQNTYKVISILGIRPVSLMMFLLKRCKRIFRRSWRKMR